MAKATSSQSQRKQAGESSRSERHSSVSRQNVAYLFVQQSANLSTVFAWRLPLAQFVHEKANQLHHNSRIIPLFANVRHQAAKLHQLSKSNFLPNETMKLKMAPSLSSTGKDRKRHHKNEAYASLDLKRGAKLRAAIMTRQITTPTR